KPRALDTAPAFQPNLLRRKRREGVARRNHRPPESAAQTQTPDPVGISLLRAKNGLDNGVHFTPHPDRKVEEVGSGTTAGAFRGRENAQGSARGRQQRRALRRDWAAEDGIGLAQK